MKNGKIISFTLALVFIVFSLTACVGKDTDDTSGSSVNTGETVWTETGNTAQTVNETDTLQRSTTVDDETEKPLSEESQTAVDPFELLSSAIGKSRISAAKYDLTATDVKFSTSNSALTKLIADYIDSETVSKQNSKGTAIEKPAFAAIKKRTVFLIMLPTPAGNIGLHSSSKSSRCRRLHRHLKRDISFSLIQKP